MYKLISLDLDGTLFNDASKVSERNLKAIHGCHELGIETVVATGRPPRFTFDCIPEELSKDYCVCYNGAHIYYNKELILEKCMKDETVRGIIELVLSMNNDIKMALESENVIYSNFDVSKYWAKIQYKSLDELASYDHICKLLIINNEAIEYDELLSAFEKDCYIIQTDKGNLIEIMDKRVSKYEAIKWIAEKEGIDIHEVIAFGDDFNDKEILMGVGLGVAMENGHDVIKKVADQVTLSNEEDGVAICLERLFGVL